jgi:hypothetical protein
MSKTNEYRPPKVRTWSKPTGGRFANISELFSQRIGGALPGKNVNVVPVVANGKVYVTSYDHNANRGVLNIFRLQ